MIEEPIIIKKRKFWKKNLFLTIMLMLLISVVGGSYAFFRYYKVGPSKEIIAGSLYLKLNDGTDDLTLDKVFPESKEEARANDRTDNVLSFTLSGINTTNNKDIYYEIMLNEGEDISGKNRFDASDLRFDLIEIIDGTRTMVVDAMSFASLNNRRIWVNTIDSSTNDEVNVTYELRMWLSDSVIISDTESYADYTTDEFKNSFANVEVVVFGDFKEKDLPYNYMAGLGTFNSSSYVFWPSEINAIKSNINEVNFVSMPKSVMEKRYNAATIKKDVTDTTKSESGSVLSWLENDELVTNDDGTETQYYKMYIASDGITFFPSNSSRMFESFINMDNISFENINMSTATDIGVMFYNCSKLTSIDVSDWDVSNVTLAAQTFFGCSGLTSLDVSKWDVSNFVRFDSMFYGCSNLTSLEVSNWDVHSGAATSDMFYNCSSLKNLDVSNWFMNGVIEVQDVYGVYKMSNVFYNCSSLTSLDVSNWNLSGVTTMSSMFRGCVNLTSLDVSYWDVSSVTNMSNMFYGCSSLTTIYANSDWNTGTVTSSSYMFYNCTKLVGAVSYDSSKRDVTMANTDGYFTKKTA